jgi:hypothetical protein
LSSYLRAADFLNISNVDIVCLQHEFGIFGGPAGGHRASTLRHDDERPRLILVLVPQKRRTTY